jgi:hypothetical protein
MKITDDELSKIIRQDGLTEDTPQEDLTAYRHILRALSKEPDYPLSGDFAEKVVKRATSLKRPAASGEMLWLILGLLGLVTLFIGSLIMLRVKIEFGFLSNLSHYWIFIAMGVLLFMLIQFLDHKYIRPTFR